MPEDPAITGYPKGPMVAAWHEAFAKQLQAIATQHNRDGAEPWDLDVLELHMDPSKNGFGSGNHVVNYIGSHDQERILKQIAEIGGTFGEAAFRLKLATALPAHLAGIADDLDGPGIRRGQSKDDGASADRLVLLANKDNTDLKNYTQGLVNMRRSEPALAEDKYEVVLKDPGRHLFGYKRWNEAGNVLVVLANLNDTPAGDVTIENVGLEDGTWHEYVFNFDATVAGGKLTTDLGPSEVKIFIKQ